MKNIQINENGKLKHLLTIEGLTKNIIDEIFVRADSFIDSEKNNVKKVDLLTGKTICNLFLKTAQEQEPHLK